MPLIVPGITPAMKKSDQHSNEKSTDHDEKLKAQHFQAQPGPAIPDDTTPFKKSTSKEEQHARAKELNEKK